MKTIRTSVGGIKQHVKRPHDVKYERTRTLCFAFPVDIFFALYVHVSLVISVSLVATTLDTIHSTKYQKMTGILWRARYILPPAIMVIIPAQCSWLIWRSPASAPLAIHREWGGHAECHTLLDTDCAQTEYPSGIIYIYNCCPFPTNVFAFSYFPHHLLL